MKKILFFVQLPPPLHGASLCNKNLINSKVISSEFDLRVLPISFNKTIEDMQKNNVFKLFRVVPLVFKLIKELILFKPDIVYFSISPLGSAFLRDVLFVSIIKVFRTEIVYHLHGKGIADVTSSCLNKLYRYVFNKSTIICLSPRLAKDIDDVKGNANVTICPNGIVTGDFDRHIYTPTSKLKLLFLSNLLPSKGIKIYLEAALLLIENGFDVEVNIAGPFNLKYTEKEFQSFLNNNKKLQAVTYYHGSVTGAIKWELLGQTDVLIHPTLNDAFPLVILEAMSAGCVIVSTEQGGIPDILENKSFGFLLNETTSRCLFEQVKVILEQQDSIYGWSRESELEFNDKYTFKGFENRIANVFKGSNVK